MPEMPAPMMSMSKSWISVGGALVGALNSDVGMLSRKEPFGSSTAESFLLTLRLGVILSPISIEATPVCAPWAVWIAVVDILAQCLI